MNALFKKYPNAGAGAGARKQSTDQVNMNLEWTKSRGENLRKALEIISEQ